MKRMIRAVVAGLALGALPLGVALSSAGATTACSTSTGHTSCTTSATATVTAGTLTIEAPATLSWTATLSGVNKNISAALPVSVVDATGSGAGWKAEVAMTHLKSTTALSATVTLNSSTSTTASTAAPSASCGATSTCTLNIQTAPPSYPLTVPQPTTATTLPAASIFETAKVTTGMGVIDLPLDAWLHIKANAKAGTYTGTVQISVVSGP